MLIIICLGSLVLGLLLALGLIYQTRAVVARKSSARGQLWKYASLISFVAVFYFQPAFRTEIGLSYLVGAILGLALGIVAKQRGLR